MADRMSIDTKPEPPRQDDSDESANSSHESEQQPPAVPQENVSQETQQPKRKGGRKPIYATSEERKQRNRQAQAAFRERRTEYIKQLEETIRIHESSLCNLQNAHRSAAEECLMLRCKNSLLERILLEKGIDVQAELQAKGGSPHLGSTTHVPKPMVQPAPFQHRALINRHHQACKSISGVAPKHEPLMTPLPTALPPQKPTVSPKHRASASSHSGSPINSVSAFSPAPSDSVSNRGSVGGIVQPTAGGRPATRPPAMAVGHKGRAQSVSSGATFYSTPTFHNPVDQLGEHELFQRIRVPSRSLPVRYATEHEFEGKHEIVDETEMVPYAGAFNGDNQQAMLLSSSSTSHGPQVVHPQVPTRPGQSFPSMTQLLDQGVDWDPFGLNASLQFPAHPPFQFDQANLR